MTILCLGCSWTDKYHKDIKPWPEVIQSKTNERVINLGKNGSGNKYAYDQFLNYMRTKEKPSTVYWLMTEFDRIDCISVDSLHGFHTIKTLTQGKNREKFLQRWLEVRAGKEQGHNLEREKRRVEEESEFASVIADLYSPLDFIDNNLHMLYMVQSLCEHYNINLKVGAALSPIRTYFIDNMSDQDLGWAMLKSKYSKNLKTANIMGWPFYRPLGGNTGSEIKNWREKYGIALNDNHPNQEGSNLLASFFLGEKNINEYK